MIDAFLIPFKLIYAIALTIFIDFLVYKRYAGCLAIEFDLRLYTVLKKFIKFREVVSDVFYDFVEFFDAVDLHFSEQILYVCLVLHGFSVEAVEKMGFIFLQKTILCLSLSKRSRYDNLLCHPRSKCVLRLLLWEWR